MKLRSLALITAFALAACGGGGGGSAVPSVPGPTSPIVSNPDASTTATVTLRIPLTSGTSSASHKTPQYISSATTSLKVIVNTVDGNTPPSWVPLSTTTALNVGSNCQIVSSAEDCTVSVAAPVGNVSYTFDAIGQGSFTLSTVTTTLAIAQGQANSLSATLDGVAYAVVTGVLAPLTVASSSGTHAVNMIADGLDASGEYITQGDTLADPYTITDTDTTGATSLSVNSGPPVSTITITTAGEFFTLNYNGQAINTFDLTIGGTDAPDGGTVLCDDICNVTGPNPADVTFSGTTDDTTPNGGLITDANWGQQTVYFSQVGGASQTITASELGFTGFGGTFDLTFDPTTCGTGPNAVADATSLGPNTSFTIQAENVGVCKAKLTETGTGYPLTDPGHSANSAGAETHDGTFWISVTSSSFGINSHGRRPPN